jgi:hypothetical protein
MSSVLLVDLRRDGAPGDFYNCRENATNLDPKSYKTGPN